MLFLKVPCPELMLRSPLGGQKGVSTEPRSRKRCGRFSMCTVLVFSACTRGRRHHGWLVEVAVGWSLKQWVLMQAGPWAITEPQSLGSPV